MTQDPNNRKQERFGAPPPSTPKPSGAASPAPGASKFVEEPTIPTPVEPPKARPTIVAETAKSGYSPRSSSAPQNAMPWVLAAIILVLSFVHHNSQANEIAELKKLDEQTKAELQITHAAAEQLKTENASLQDQLDQANRPQAEVLVNFIKPVFGNGYYARVVNTGSSTLVYTTRITRPSTGTGKTWTLTIDAGRFTDIGEQEGWAFISGDTITVTQSNHKAYTLSLR